MDRVTVGDRSFDLEQLQYLTCLTTDIEHFLFDQKLRLRMDKDFYFQHLTLMHWNNGDIEIKPYSSYGYNDFYILFDPRCIIVNRPAVQYLFQRTSIPKGYGAGLRPYWRYTLFIPSKSLLNRREWIDFLLEGNAHKVEAYCYGDSYVTRDAKDYSPTHSQCSLLGYR